MALPTEKLAEAWDARPLPTCERLVSLRSTALAFHSLGLHQELKFSVKPQSESKAVIAKLSRDSASKVALWMARRPSLTCSRASYRRTEP